MSIDSLLTVIKENNIIVMLVLTHIFAFFVGLSISDRKTVFASVLSWYMQFKVKLKAINSISENEYNDICEDLIMIAMSLCSGADEIGSHALVLDNLRHKRTANNENVQILRQEAISKIEDLIHSSLKDLEKIRKKRTLLNLLDIKRKILHGVKYDNPH